MRGLASLFSELSVQGDRLLGGTGVQRRDMGSRHVIALTKTALSPQLGVPCGFQNEQAWCLFMEAPCWSRGQ